MRNFYCLLCFVCLFLNIHFVKAQKDTVLIDFGDPTMSSVSPWNNLTSPDSGTVANNLLNSAGVATPMGIVLYDAFNGINTGGTQTPDVTLNMPILATRDSYFGNTVLFGSKTEPAGGLVFSGLYPTTSYTFTIFASRMSVSDNRETKYRFEGSTLDSVYLNASNNTGDTATVTLMPKADGTIRMQVSPGPNNNNGYGFYYLGAIRISYEHVDIQPYITITSPNGGETWVSGTERNITWSGTSIIEDIHISYSINNGTTWVPVATVPSSQTSYSWDIPDSDSKECIVKVETGTLSDVSNAVFNISDLPSCTIVVLGSSTAAGSGPSKSDSAWVQRFSKALGQNFKVVNLAVGGYTTFQILPTGTVLPAGINEFIDVNKNITKALTYDPYVIIVNMPSNDATKFYSVQQQLDNFKIINDLATSSGVKLWIATPQPRNFSNPQQIQIQLDLTDSIKSIYGDFSIDFWTGLSSSNGFINSIYNSGDGIHLNNAAHKLLFERVWEKRIDTLQCCANVINKIDSKKKFTDTIKVYPNPFNENFNIEISTISHGDLELKFYDSLSRLIFRKDVNISSAGIHTIQINNSQIFSNHSIIIGVITFRDNYNLNRYCLKLVKGIE